MWNVFYNISIAMMKSFKPRDRFGTLAHPSWKYVGKRHVSIARADDSFDVRTKLEDAHKLPEFAASNFSRFPERQPEEMNLWRIVQLT